jgi:broad specificity phosphatase PhoE
MSDARVPRRWWPFGGWCFWFGRCLPTTILIRHADVTGTGDPPLNAAGLARAQELRHVLADSDLAAIFVTSFQRSQMTAAPIAADLGITPTVIDGAALIADAIRAQPGTATVLVVGHTDTLPVIVSALGGPSLTAIGSTQFDRLFVLHRGRLVRLRYGA